MSPLPLQVVRRQRVDVMGRVVYRSDNPNGFVTGKDFSIDQPCVTIMAAGMGGDSLGHWHFVDRGGRT